MLVKSETNKTLKGHKLLVVAPWEAPAGYVDKLTAAFPDLEVVYHLHSWAGTPPATATITDETWKDVTILVTFATLPTPEQAPKLEFVQLMSAGVNHVVERPLFKDTEVAFCTANGVHGPQISEWIISTYLAFEHRLPGYLQHQKEGHWDREDLHTIEDSADKTIIGRQTARVASAMGMAVHACTLHARETPESRRDRGWTPRGLGDPEGAIPARWFSGGSAADLRAFLTSGLDLLVVATPLTGQTRHLLGAAEFEALAGAGEGAGGGRRGRTFVSNIARGPVVDTDALLSALDSGAIRGAALDVTDPEPLPDGHPLWAAKNIIITPHVSGASTRYFERVLAILEVNLGRLAEGGELVNKVDRGQGY